MSTKNGEETRDLQCPEEQNEKMRGEIDTSAPFESVKEAASRFGGFGFWRPTSQKHHSSDNSLQHVDDEGFDISKLEEEAAQLQRDLIMKERETLDVLKELEKTKLIVEELRFKVSSEVSSDDNMEVVAQEENHSNVEPMEEEKHQQMEHERNQCPSSTPDFILKELKRAKLNLTKTTGDLVDIRTTVELYKQKIEKERISMEMTRQRISSNVSKISSLEEELLQATQRLQLPGNAGGLPSSDDPAAIANELQRLSSETEQFKKMGDAARSEVLKAISDIEQTKTKLKTAEMRLIAARKMKEAARASEAVALADIKWLSTSEPCSATQENPEGVTLTFEEFTSLVSKAQEAEEASKKIVTDAMLLVDEANESKSKILKKIEETTEEVQTSKKALEDAFDRVEAANSGKLVVEEALRKWRSERSQKKRTSRDTPKFKNAGVHHHSRDPALLDVNGIDLAPAHDDSKPVLMKPSLSIGQILSRKLLLTEEYENGMLARKSTGKRKVSLGQMLGKTGCEIQSDVKGDKENNPQQLPAKRKNFGFAKISFLRPKQTKKKKKRSAISC